jgi:hypothetical protein
MTKTEFAWAAALTFWAGAALARGYAPVPAPEDRPASAGSRL